MSPLQIGWVVVIVLVVVGLAAYLLNHKPNSDEATYEVEEEHGWRVRTDSETPTIKRNPLTRKVSYRVNKRYQKALVDYYTDRGYALEFDEMYRLYYLDLDDHLILFYADPAADSPAGMELRPDLQGHIHMPDGVTMMDTGVGEVHYTGEAVPEGVILGGSVVPEMIARDAAVKVDEATGRPYIEDTAAMRESSPFEPYLTRDVEPCLTIDVEKQSDTSPRSESYSFPEITYTPEPARYEAPSYHHAPEPSYTPSHSAPDPSPSYSYDSGSSYDRGGGYSSGD